MGRQSRPVVYQGYPEQSLLVREFVSFCVDSRLTTNAPNQITPQLAVDPPQQQGQLQLAGWLACVGTYLLHHAPRSSGGHVWRRAE